MLYGINFPDDEWTKPAFIITNASMSMSFQYSSYGTNDAEGDHAMYKTMVRETRGTETRELASEQLTQKAMPLFVGHAKVKQQAGVATQSGNRTGPGRKRAVKVCGPGFYASRQVSTHTSTRQFFTINGEHLRFMSLNGGGKQTGYTGISIVRIAE